MSTPQFPSGPWTGYYNYEAGGQRFRMDLIIAFAHRRITGEGGDLVGQFVIDGRYVESRGECAFNKIYIGAHEVLYSGFREGKGIWGTWEMPRSLRGGFHIWPVGEEPAEVATAALEEAITPSSPSIAVLPPHSTLARYSRAACREPRHRRFR